MKPSVFSTPPSESKVLTAPAPEQEPAPTIWTAPLPHIVSVSGTPGETVRHILLGRAGAVRQTIHLLHSLHYAETVLWSPVMPLTKTLAIEPASGETISLLRKTI